MRSLRPAAIICVDLSTAFQTLPVQKGRDGGIQQKKMGQKARSETPVVDPLIIYRSNFPDGHVTIPIYFFFRFFSALLVTLKGPSQPHLYFCLHARVCLLYFIRRKSKRSKSL